MKAILCLPVFVTLLFGFWPGQLPPSGHVTEPLPLPAVLGASFALPPRAL